MSFSYWNYKIFRELDDDYEEYFTIREVHYSPDGEIMYWSEPIPPGGDSVEDLSEDLQLMATALNSDVLDASELNSKYLQ